MVLSRMVHSVFENAVLSRFFSAVEGRFFKHPNLLQVLTYHRVDDLDGFERQMRFLAENYSPVHTTDVIRAFRQGHPLPPRAVLLTFDDAYQNFGDSVWPVLKRWSIPAAMFVPTAFPGDASRVFWWDRLEHALAHTTLRDPIRTDAGTFAIATRRDRVRAYKRLRAVVKAMPHRQALVFVDRVCETLQVPPPPSSVMNWDTLRLLAKDGVTLGAHTQTHPLMNRVSLAEAVEEANGSLEDLRREIGAVEPLIAYPAGGFSDEVLQAMRDAGFVLGFSTIRGVNDPARTNPLLIRRNNIGRRATLPVLRARMLQSALTGREGKPLLIGGD